MLSRLVVRDAGTGSALGAYGVALAAAILVTAAKLALGPQLGREAPFALFGLGILAAGWLGGPRSAAAATVLLVLASIYFFLRPTGSWSLAAPGSSLQLASLVAEGGIITGIVAAIYSTRLQKEEAAQRAQRLQALTAGLASARSANEVADVVVGQAVALLGPATGALALPRPDGKLHLVAHHGQSEATLRDLMVFSPEDPLPAARAFHTGNLEWIQDPETFASRYPAMASRETRGRAGMLSMPLISNGRVIGATTYRFDRPRQLAEADRDLLRTFASLAAQALDRALTAERAAAYRTRLEALNDLAAALAGALTREDVAAVMVRRGMAAMAADTCTLYVVDEGDGALDLIGQAGVAPAIARLIQRIPRDSGNPVAATLVSAQPLWAENEQEYLALFPVLAAMKTDGPRAHAFWSFPLFVEGGRAIGLLAMGFYRDRQFSDEERAFIQTFTAHCAQALRRAQRLEAERQARQNAERIQTLLATTLHSIGDAVITTDRAGAVTFMNPVAETLTGWSQDDARGKPLRAVFRIVNASTRQEVESPVERVLRDGVVVGLANHTVLLGLQPGQETPIDDSGAPIRGPDGQVQGVVLVFRDVRAKKEAEARQAFAADAVGMLGASLDYEATLSQLAKAVVPRLADWCSVDVVDPLTGEARGLAIARVDPGQVDEARTLARRFAEQVLRTGRSEFLPEVAPETLPAGAGDFKPRSLMVVPLLARGRTLGAITFASAESGRVYRPEDLAFVEDLARRAAVAVDNAQLYSAEQRARRAADGANRSKDDFLATVSHELRTPLTAILGWARLMARGGMEDDRRIKAVDTIERNAVAMAQLVEDLLDISRIISGRLRLDVQPVDLPRVIQAAVDSIRPAIDAKSLTLQVDEEHDLAAVVGDPMRLQQVMWNLLSNAAKFTPKGGRIAVGMRRQESSLVVTVTDNGKGIAPEFLPHVFDPFRQADSSIRRAHGGLGLGLAISKQLVELHGGSISANSDGEGQGARFHVTLPISVLRAESAGVPRAVREREVSRATFEPPAALRGLRVLLVDDETDARQLVRAILESCHAVVREASSVAEALEAFAHEIPDVIISDIGLPGQDGFVLIDKVRALPAARGGGVPVVALTAFTRAEDRLAVLKAGFTLHVPKPVDPGELAVLIAGLAGHKIPDA